MKGWKIALSHPILFQKISPHAVHEAKERILEGDAGGDPEIVFGAGHALRKIAVEPAVGCTNFDLTQLKDQKVLEDFGWPGDKIGIEQNPVVGRGIRACKSYSHCQIVRTAMQISTCHAIY